MNKAVFLSLFLFFACTPDPAVIHEQAFVVDAPSDALYRISSHGGDLGGGSSHAHVDIEKMKSGGIDLQFMAVWVPARFRTEGGPTPSPVVPQLILRRQLAT